MVLVLLLLALASVGPRSATAAVLTVTDCGDTTPGGAPGQLRRLITDAVPGDTIVIPGCLITLTGAANEDDNAGGDLDITKALTIRGAGARATIIDGGLIDRVFDVNPGGLPLPPLNNVTISDLMVRNGRGGTRGGGIRNTGNLTLQRVVVRNNVVLQGTLEAGGGGIANEGVLHAEEITVEGNSASGPVIQSGGGIHNAGTLTLTRSTVNGNVVAAAETFSNSGGIANSGTLTLIDSTISSNHGGHDGPGGILNTGTLNASGSAIVSNVSLGPTNGIKSSGVVSLTNSIVANNGGNQCQGVVSSVGGNLATDSTCNLIGPNDAVAADAGLGPLGPQGGPTPTHPLLPGSPAIDTALPVQCTATDQRGMPRPQDGDGNGTAICDKGPFEFTPPVFADVGVTHFARGAPGERHHVRVRTGHLLSGCSRDSRAAGRVPAPVDSRGRLRAASGGRPVRRRAGEQPLRPMDRAAVHRGHHGRLRGGAASLLPGRSRDARPDRGPSVANAVEARIRSAPGRRPLRRRARG
jgi:hypothetical protein